MTQQALNGDSLGANPQELSDAPDFGNPQRRRNLFKVDDEVFEAAAGLPVDQGMEFIALAEQWPPEDVEAAKAGARELFSKVLLPESFERFTGRLGDMERPIELTQLPSIIQFLLERFTGRPTPEPSGSSTGSANQGAGTNSTVVSPPLALIPTASPSPGS